MRHDEFPCAALTYRIIGFAMCVHRRLGPRLLESIYETCLGYELHRAGVPFRRQVRLAVRYDDVRPGWWLCCRHGRR